MHTRKYICGCTCARVQTTQTHIHTHHLPAFAAFARRKGCGDRLPVVKRVLFEHVELCRSTPQGRKQGRVVVTFDTVLKRDVIDLLPTHKMP